MYEVKLKKPLQPQSEKMKMLVEDSDKVGGESEFVLSTKLSWAVF